MTVVPLAPPTPAGRRSRSTASRSASREGATILDACRGEGVDTPTLCFARQPDAGQRVPGVRGRGRGLARAGAGCSRKAEAGMEVQTDTERVRHSRKLVLEFLASCRRRSRAPTSQRWLTDYGADPSASAPRASRRRRASATRATPGHHHEPDGAAAETVAPAGEGRQRALRARLRELHPLLQVRRGVRHRRAEHVRDRRRRPRVRRADLDRVRRRRCRTPRASTAATASACARPAR